MKTERYKKMFKLIIISMMALLVTIFVGSVNAKPAGRGASGNAGARSSPAASARVQAPSAPAAAPSMSGRSSPAGSPSMSARSQPMISAPSISSRSVSPPVSMPSISQRATEAPRMTAPSTTTQVQTFRVPSNPTITVRGSNRSTIAESRSAAPVVRSEQSNITINENKIGAPISVNRGQSSNASAISRGNENSRVNVIERGPASRTETPTVIVSAEKKAEIGNVIGGNKPAGSAAQARRETVVRDNIAAPQSPAVVEKLSPGTNSAAADKDKISRIGEVVGRQPNRETAPRGQEKGKEQMVSRIETNRTAETERVVASKTPVTELPAMKDREGNAARRESRQAIGEKIGEKPPVTQLPELKDREGNAARRDSRQVGEKIGEPAPVTQGSELKEREGNVSRREARSREAERAIEGKNPVTEAPATAERDGTKGTELVREGRRTERREPERVAPDEERELSKDIVAKHPQMRHGREDENIMYHDREHYDGDHHDGDHHHDRFIFFGYNSSWCYWPVWPSYYYWVNYNWGGYSSFCYVHPYYHRRYVFVSLGGWWPYHYSYMRYYRYGWHPYNWYGYYPVAYEIPYDDTSYYTYNYYTYNYYNTDSTAQTGTITELPAVNEYTFADVRERMAQQAVKEPAPETLADKLFDEGVNAFDLNVFSLAADKFAEAIKLAPDDMILPFAYAQSLFAMGNYTEAAEALRNALKNVKPEQEGVFYPRGLYHEDKILLDQIEGLAEKAKLYSFDADLQLLLGYQLLGIGETDEALEHLILASRDMTNATSAQILLDVQRKIKEGQNKQISNNIQTGKALAGIEYMPAAGHAGGTEQWQSNTGTNWRYAAWLFAAWQPQMLLAVGKHSRYIL